MSVQACKGCGGLFAFLPRGLCTACIDAREESFHSVRDHLRDNRGASILDASAATGVEERLIAEFIREGRLQFADDTAPSVEELRARDALRARIAVQMSTAPTATSPSPSPPAGASPGEPGPQPRRSGMKSRLS